jgi:hypothetical protein
VHKEIEQLHVELLWVYSAIEAKHDHFKHTLLKLEKSQDPIHVAVTEFCRCYSKVN